jgi:hypothetical protein
MIRSIGKAIAILLVVLGVEGAVLAEDQVKVVVNWGNTVATSKLIPSVYVVNSPMMRPSSPIHACVYQGLKELGVDDLRYMSYFTFPKLSVAELYPPKDKTTSWDFSLMDPMVVGIFKAAEGHPVMMTFSTVPTWMFKRNEPVSYPDNPNAYRTIDSPQGTELVDVSAQQLADYYARLYSWYTQGGFTDEFGKYHRSGYRFNIRYWEVLNEPDLELRMSVQNYTKLYDKVVAAIRRINPSVKFVGLSMAISTPDRLEYFLDPKNHEPGIPLDMISYHGYSVPQGPSDGPDQWQYSYFSQASEFLQKIDFIENIRKRLAPSTRTAINETGSLLNPDLEADPSKIPHSYWNASGALYAYLYLSVSRRDIDALHMSQGVGYPSFFPDLAMFDWVTCKPNARYQDFKLIKDNFGPGDRLIDTQILDDTGHSMGELVSFADVAAQAYEKEAGTRKLLLINKKNHPVDVALPKMVIGALVQTVDVTSGGNPPRVSTIKSERMELTPFSVSVITLK